MCAYSEVEGPHITSVFTISKACLEMMEGYRSTDAA